MANLLSKLFASFAALICQLQLTLKSLLSRSSMFIDGNGGTYEVDLEDIESSKADPLGETPSSQVNSEDSYHLQHNCTHISA